MPCTIGKLLQMLINMMHGARYSASMRLPFIAAIGSVFVQLTQALYSFSSSGYILQVGVKLGSSYIPFVRTQVNFSPYIKLGMIYFSYILANLFSLYLQVAAN